METSKNLTRFSYWLLETLNTEYNQYIEVFGGSLYTIHGVLIYYAYIANGLKMVYQVKTDQFESCYSMLPFLPMPTTTPHII